MHYQESIDPTNVTIPFLKGKICPVLLLVPSGAMATQSPILAEAHADPTALIACSLLLRSIGIPPKASMHQEKKGIKNSSAFPCKTK